MRLNTNIWRPAGVGLALALGVSTPLAGQTTRYVELLAGRQVGHQVVTRGDDGVIEVVYFFKDNGRGPELLERFTLADDGTFRTYEVKGSSTFGAPVDESFTREGDRVRWKSTSDQGEQSVAGAAHYSPLGGTPETVSVALGALARRADGKLPLIPGGTLTMRRIAEADVTGEHGTRTVQLIAVTGVGMTPDFVWATTGEAPRLFALIAGGGMSLIEEGWQGNVDALATQQKAAEDEYLVDRQRRLAHPLVGTTLIRNARIFDSEQAKLGAAADVLLRDGRIVSIASAGGERSAADHVIEANGRVLLPGLVDSHGHMTRWRGALHLAAGVTTVRDMGNDNAVLQQLIADVDAGRIMAPRIVPVGLIEGRSDFSSSGGFLISDLDEAKRAVDWYADNGYRQIKIYNSFPKELLRETAAYAHRKGLRVGGHVPAFMRAREAVEQGYDEIQHINQVMLNFLGDDQTDSRTLERFRLVADGTAGLDFDSQAVQEFIALLADRQTVIDPTLATFDFLRQRAGELSQAFAAVAEHLPPGLQRGMRVADMDIPDDATAARYEQSYQKLIEFVGRLHRAGVPIVAGTDWLAGFTLHRELELYVQAGMSPSDALRTATWNGARYAGVLDDRGSIEVGKRADLVLVDGDPTTNIAAIRRIALVIRGDVAYHPGEVYEALGIRPFTAPLKVESARASNAAPALRYPATRTMDAADDHHGTLVADPYRWLEDTKDPQVHAWVEAQDHLTVGYLESAPEQGSILRRLSELARYTHAGSLPFGAGGRYFHRRGDGEEAHAVLYWQESLAGEPRILLDPNTFSSDGTVPLRATSASPNGRLLAYGKGVGGTSWQEIHVRDVDTARDLSDSLRWLQHSELAWTHDSKGFFYSRFMEPEGDLVSARARGQAIYYHRLGTPQAADVRILGTPADEEVQRLSARVTGDGRYLAIRAGPTESPNAFYYLDLGAAARPRLDGDIVRLISAADAMYAFIGNEGPLFFFRTDLDAPRGRIITVDTQRPEREHWRTVVAEVEDVIDTPRLVSGHLFIGYMSDVQTRIRVFTSTGMPLREVELPAPGESWQFWAAPDGDEVFYLFQSFLHPPTVYRHDLRSGRSEVVRASEIAFDAAPYITYQRFFSSRDGTRVPMFVTHRRDLPLDGRNPTYMIGYGGGGIPWGPYFSPEHLWWLEQGGVLVLANVRGGGEYGEEWCAAGRGASKQNTFDDFIAAAEHLIAHGYTPPASLAIYGLSRGGLLVSAVLNQRPDLFGAGVVDRGVTDMLLLDHPRWHAEFGSLEDAGDFARIRAYSPYHNLRPGTCYPAALVITGDDDDAAPPAHSFKYAAALQAAQGCGRPALLRLYHGTGHGSAAVTGEEWDHTTEQKIQQATDIFTFLLRTLQWR